MHRTTAGFSYPGNASGELPGVHPEYPNSNKFAEHHHGFSNNIPQNQCAVDWYSTSDRGITFGSSICAQHATCRHPGVTGARRFREEILVAPEIPDPDGNVACTFHFGVRGGLRWRL